MKTIRMKFRPGAATSMEVVGVHGPTCDKLLEPFGQKRKEVNREQTDDFFQSDATVQNETKVGEG